MADAFLKLVNGGKKSGGANFNNLLSQGKHTSSQNLFGSSQNNNTKQNPFAKSHSAIPIRLDSNTNNLDLLSKKKKKKGDKDGDDDDGENEEQGKSIKTTKKLALPNALALQDLQRHHSILVDGEDIPALLPSFELISQEYTIPSHIASNLTSSLQDGGFGFNEPTPIQMQAIPALISKRDVMAFAPTGSGKTLAFALPMIQHIYNYSIALKMNLEKIQQEKQQNNEKEEKNNSQIDELGEWIENTLGQPAGFMQTQQPETSKYSLPIHGIVLCPTRELALQTHRVYQKIVRKREEFFTKKLEAIEILSQTDPKAAKAALSLLKQQEDDMLYIQPTLLTKKWKTRCLKSFEQNVLGQDLINDRKMKKQQQKNKKNQNHHDESDEDLDGDIEDDMAESDEEDEGVNVDTELQDCDDELNQDEENSEGKEKNKNEIVKSTATKFTILIATPLLLLSLLDRCYRIVKKDYMIHYQAFNDFKHYTTQRKMFDKFMSKAKEDNKKKSSKKQQDLHDDDEFEVAMPTPLLEKDIPMPKVLSSCQMFVIDECDRLLDLGFLQQVNNVLFHTQRVQDLYDIEQVTTTTPVASSSSSKKPKKEGKSITTTSYQLSTNRRRMVTALVSATITPSINILSQKMLTMPIKVTIGEENVAQLAIRQRLMYVSDETGKRLGMKQILSQGASLPMLVFVQSKERATQLEQELSNTFDWLNTQPETDTLATIMGNQGKNNKNDTNTNITKFSRLSVLHSDLTEQERLNTITRFRIGEVWVLICTDVIARGLDFIHVKCVLNYDFPSSTTNYLHRIGRTGRGGYKGTAITFITDDDRTLLPNIAHIVKHSESLQNQQVKEQYKKDLFVEMIKNGEMEEEDEMYDIDSDDEGYLQYRTHLRRLQLSQRTGLDVNKAAQAQQYTNAQNQNLMAQAVAAAAKRAKLDPKKPFYNRDGRVDRSNGGNRNGDRNAPRNNDKNIKNNKTPRVSKVGGENTMSDVNNLLISGTISATAMVLGLTGGDDDTSGVADWMLELPMATAKEQQQLLYKQPQREDIIHTSKSKHDKFKQKDMNIFHRKKDIAVKLGITTRNEVGKILADKLDKDHQRSGNSNNNNNNQKGQKNNHNNNTTPQQPTKRKAPSRDDDNDDDGWDNAQKMNKKRNKLNKQKK